MTLMLRVFVTMVVEAQVGWMRVILDLAISCTDVL